MGEPGATLTEPSGLAMTLIETGAASGGMRLEMEWRVPAGLKLVATDHYHPDGPEHWRLVEGAASYRLDGSEQTASAPHEYAVPAFTPHTHPANAGEATLVVRQVIAPDRPMPGLLGGIQGFFETVFAFAQRGEAGEDGRIADRLQDALTVNDLLLPGTFLAGPPRWAQRMLFGGLGALAGARGRRPYAKPRFESRGG